MVPVMSLYGAIVLSAVFVFVASAILHMVLGIHNKDIAAVANEDAALDAIRRLNLPPGDYVMPHAGTREAMKSPAFAEKMKKGPLVIMTVAPGGPITMGKPLTLWFLYCVLVSIFAAYVAGRALPAGAHYLQVFRFAGTAAFLGYSMALLQQSIWWRRKWRSTLKGMLDGLIYALLTAGTFGWLWPQ